MLKLLRHVSQAFSLRSRPRLAVLPLTTILIGIIFAVPSTQAQTFTVLYSFTGAADGAVPLSGLIMDTGGTLYGTTAAGGIFHNQTAAGVVFKLDATGTETTLATFSGVMGDGAGPLGTLVCDSLGNLYGTASSGGHGHGGRAFKVFPTGGKIGMHIFGKPSGDGINPFAGLVLDNKGNLYGTTTAGMRKPDSRPSTATLSYGMPSAGLLKTLGGALPILFCIRLLGTTGLLGSRSLGARFLCREAVALPI